MARCVACAGRRVMAALAVIALGASSSTQALLPRQLVHLGFDDSSGSTGFFKGGLRVTNRDSIAIDVQDGARSAEGTLLFWVMPQWSTPRQRSQTLVSFRWRDSDNSYFAVSQGWWEPLGAQRLYLVISNRDFASCSVPHELEPGTWTLLGFTWSAGDKGACRVFINGAKSVDIPVSYHSAFRGDERLHIGNDLGATDNRRRNADVLIDELYILDRALSDQQMLEWHAQLEGSQQSATRRRWEWLDAALRSTPGPPVVTAAVRKERRVLFDESWQWARSRKEIDGIIELLRDSGFNTYVPCVWHGAGAHYPTRTAHVRKELRAAIAAGFDPLAYLIERAHRVGIEVHPWLTVVRREDLQYPDYFESGVPPGAYDIHNERFRVFAVSLVADLAVRYDIDGVNLDYVRAMGVCVSDRCRASYAAEQRADLQVDLRNAGRAAPARERIEKWQDSAVTDLVRRTSAAVRSHRPRAIISVDGHPRPYGQMRALEGRNEMRWVREGLVDAVYSMEYGARVDLTTLDRVINEAGAPGRVIPVFANFDRIDDRAVARPPQVVARLATLARRRWPGNGVAFYLRAMLTDSQSRALRESLR